MNEPKRKTVNEQFWWAVHNLVAHPVSEILYWCWLERAGNWLHDVTVPNEGRALHAVGLAPNPDKTLTGER